MKKLIHKKATSMGDGLHPTLKAHLKALQAHGAGKLALWFLLFGMVSCGSDSSEDPGPMITEPYELEVAHQAFIVEGTASILKEVSGIAPSRITDSILWVHNDSRDASIYAISTTGMYLGKVALSGVENRGWEDMGSVKDPSSNSNYIYLAGTGDNKADYTSYFIHRIEEPQPGEYHNNSINRNSQTIEFTYDDIESQNVDAMTIDPQTLDIFLFSKGLNQSRVYVIRNPFSSTGTAIAERIGSLSHGLVVSADMGNNQLLIKTYSDINCFGMKENIENTLETTPSTLVYFQEAQGEAVCWDISDRGYYTFGELTPEAPEPTLNFYKFIN